MLLVVLPKIRQLGVYTFFLTCSAAGFHYGEYGKTLTDEVVNTIDWSTKVNYLKRNPVTIASQTDQVFQQVWAKVILSGIHLVGQILIFHDNREFQNKGIKHIHAPIHLPGAPKIYQNMDIKVTKFIDEYIICTLSDQQK